MIKEFRLNKNVDYQQLLRIAQFCNFVKITVGKIHLMKKFDSIDEQGEDC